MNIRPATAEDLLATKKKGHMGDPVIDFVLEHGSAKVEATSRLEKTRIATNARNAALKRGVKIRIHFSATDLIVVKA